MEVVELYRAWNWVAFGHLSGDMDEGVGQAVFLDTGAVLVLPAFTEADEYEREGRLALARDLLGAAIESGKIDLFGIRTAEGPSVANAREFWEKVPPAFMAEAGFESEDEGISLMAQEIEYTRLYVPFDQLRALFPFWGEIDQGPAGQTRPDIVAEGHLAEPIGPATATTAAAETECGKFISTLAKDTSGATKSKREVWNLAKGTIGERLSYKGFLRAWDRGAPVSWRKPGRKSKRLVQ